MVNWNSGLRRALFTFLTLFFLAYVVPGLSAYTVTHLLWVSLLSAFLATVGESFVLADAPGEQRILLFGVSALTIYFYAFVFLRERLPVVSVLLAAGLIAVLDYYLPRVHVDTGAGRGMAGEGDAEPGPGQPEQPGQSEQPGQPEQPE